MPLVVAENLMKSYGKVKAVDGLSLTLYEGSVTAFVLYSSFCSYCWCSGDVIGARKKMWVSVCGIYISTAF
ncbi:hypothetical protein KEJ14_02075 [Candidatus Bathyarchaeota archaeon]|nr:hypothetical protein [Candidatus Bathyarchaeota archaeon]